MATPHMACFPPGTPCSTRDVRSDLRRNIVFSRAAQQDALLLPNPRSILELAGEQALGRLFSNSLYPVQYVTTAVVKASSGN
jgi:hypothetical protein